MMSKKLLLQISKLKMSDKPLRFRYFLDSIDKSDGSTKNHFNSYDFIDVVREREKLKLDAESQGYIVDLSVRM
jgi:hypothetical protein